MPNTNGDHEKSAPIARDTTISLLDVERTPADPGTERLVLRTDRGNITGLWHPTGPDGAPGTATVVWIGGASGGIEGPARGVYHLLADRLVPDGISSLRLHYRHPTVIVDCIADVLVALAWLEDACDVRRAALVGYAFGGAVAIDAGALSPIVKAVVTLASQTYGADLVGELGPRGLLLIHGEADTILPPACSQRLYDAAEEPRELVLYPACGHSLDECAAALQDRLYAYLRRELAPLGDPPAP